VRRKIFLHLIIFFVRPSFFGTVDAQKKKLKRKKAENERGPYEWEAALLTAQPSFASKWSVKIFLCSTFAIHVQCVLIQARIYNN